MPTVVLSQPEVRRLLPMAACIDLMQEALAALGRGDGVNPLRWGIRLPDSRGLLGMMPGFLGSPTALGIKVVTVLPGNHGTEYDSHQGVVILFDPVHGVPVLIADASEVTAIRTAAATAVATRVLARDDAQELAILGSGVQARTHLEAMLLVRPIRRVRVYSPNRAGRDRFASEAARRHDVTVEATKSAREAVAAADIICTTTSAREPVLFGEWLEPGMHVNAVGSSVPSARELDGAAVAKARLFVDRRESALAESGDFLSAREEGVVSDGHIVAEVGDVLLHQIAGRQTPQEITLFKSLGLAVEDVAAARFLHEQAIAQGVGTTISLGGVRHAGD